MDACDQKSAQNDSKERQAEAYINAAREQDAAGNKMEAEKQYLFAKNIYEELNMDDKVAEIEGLIRIIELEIQQAGAIQGDTGWGG